MRNLRKQPRRFSRGCVLRRSTIIRRNAGFAVRISTLSWISGKYGKKSVFCVFREFGFFCEKASSAGSAPARAISRRSAKTPRRRNRRRNPRNRCGFAKNASFPISTRSCRSGFWRKRHTRRKSSRIWKRNSCRPLRIWRKRSRSPKFSIFRFLWKKSDFCVFFLSQFSLIF